MRNALMTLELSVSPKRLLQETAADQHVRENGEATPGDLGICLSVQAIQRFSFEVGKVQTPRGQHRFGKSTAETNDVALPRVSPSQKISLHFVDHGVKSLCTEDLPGKGGKC